LKGCERTITRIRKEKRGLRYRHSIVRSLVALSQGFLLKKRVILRAEEGIHKNRMGNTILLLRKDIFKCGENRRCVDVTILWLHPGGMPQFLEGEKGSFSEEAI